VYDDRASANDRRVRLEIQERIVDTIPDMRADIAFILRWGAVCASLVATTIGDGDSVVAAEERRPNIVFILADDLGWRDTGHSGSTFYETPHLDRLAKRGVSFSTCHSASPVCTPSRASLLTGLYAERLGMTQPAGHIAEAHLRAALPERAAPRFKLIQPRSATRLDPRFPSIATVLKPHGYATAHVGKWHLGPEPYSPLEHGFDVDIPHLPGHGPSGSYFGPKTYGDGFALASGEHLEDRMAREAARFIEAHKDAPFFLNYWAFSVHSPYFAKPELLDKYRRKAALLPPGAPQRNPVYAAMIESFDDAVGTLVDAIERAGIADHTIIIFTSDNGGVDRVAAEPGQKAWGNGTEAELHEIPITDNAPLKNGKGTIEDGGTRVPCFVVWPGITAAGRESDAFFSGVDMFPTIIDMAGVTLPPHVTIDGVSQVPALRGAAAPRDTLFGFWPNYTPRQPTTPAAWVRRGRHKLIRYFHDGPENADRFTLFDMETDPGETADLAAAMPERVAELRGVLDRHLVDTQAVLPAPNPHYRPDASGRIGD
jgi:arylsulfatase A-like enzyme